MLQIKVFCKINQTAELDKTTLQSIKQTNLLCDQAG